MNTTLNLSRVSNSYKAYGYLSVGMYGTWLDYKTKGDKKLGILYHGNLKLGGFFLLWNFDSDLLYVEYLVSKWNSRRIEIVHFLVQLKKILVQLINLLILIYLGKYIYIINIIIY